MYLEGKKGSDFASHSISVAPKIQIRGKVV